MRRVVVVVASVVALACLLPWTAPSHSEAPVAVPAAAPRTEAARTPAQRPNIVLIMTDDMRLSDLSVMPHVKRLIARQGVRFTQGISPNPLCCPARASLLTGQNSQNNGVWTNAGPHGGYRALEQKNNTLPRWLHRVGYSTGLIGKFLNGYSLFAGRPKGWDLFDPTLNGVYSYRYYQQWRNGHPAWIHRYVTRYVADASARAIAGFAAQKRPFFLWSAYVAPHDSNQTNCQDGMLGCWKPPIPARVDGAKFATAMPPAYGTASYLQQDMSGRPGFLRAMPTDDSTKIILEHRARLRSLQAVDRAVAQTVSALRSARVLSNTLVVFTSDNGYSLGEHRWLGKVLPYEEDVRVPLLLRGPGIPAHTVAPQVATTADLTQTFVRLAGATAGRPTDGVSLRAYWREPATPDRRSGTILQSGGDDFLAPSSGWLYRGYRTASYTYARYASGLEELYDRTRDPLELTNVAGDPAYATVLAQLRQATAAAAANRTSTEPR